MATPQAAPPQMAQAPQAAHPTQTVVVQPVPVMQTAMPVMGMGRGGPCPMCGNLAPPLTYYEINGTGWIAFVVCLFLGCGLGGLILLCVMCSNTTEPDSCHQPVAKCAACGAIRGGAIVMM